ncbi:hypothetical protein [Parabacteroides sp. PF5-9]|uniref:hypothetical protein n=1 Tax=Parabacteroides sp. PF5-9 TaxID=1742404 RepID=UPI002473311B|nr:hypothetical protein [Parabacteroides sp. PF5-9]MDH6358959.1 hypothetical protein [Parabacteroides sp. PF5-9]
MKCREVTTQRGEDFTLTIEEEKFLRALERLSKMNPGRLRLFANGLLDIRINDCWADDSFYNHKVILSCEGGDGGDNV